MFTAAYRDEIRETLVARARADANIVAAAFVGSSAVGGDRWSDLDLTFSVAAAADRETVMAEWTTYVTGAFDAAVLFDVSAGASVYRVFLFPGALQVDLSFTPEHEFAARGPRFRLIFGSAEEGSYPVPVEADQLFGLAIHHVVRTHICIVRERYWQAEYWLHQARDIALTLACREAGVDDSHGRGFDYLPADELAEFAKTLICDLSPATLRAALDTTTSCLLRAAIESATEANRVREILTALSDSEGAD